MKHKAQLTISKPSYGDNRRSIAIAIRDTDAGIDFLEIEIPLDGFAECITGLSSVDCTMTFRGLENVGKQIERKPFEIEIPKETVYSKDRAKNSYEIAKRLAPVGWKVDSYFGSQNSFFRKNEKEYARTIIKRWVEKGEK